MEITVPVLLCLVLLLIFLISIQYLKRYQGRSTNNLPPGPKPYPIIGNILDIGKSFHRSIHELSQTYGPILSLHLGSMLVIVVSSPETARELITKNQERVLVNFSPTIASKVQDHHKYSLIFRSMDKGWQKLRKICKEHMFSTRCLDASQGPRQEMMTRMCNYISKCSVEGRVIDVGEASFVTMLNLISASLFSTFATDYESGDAHEFRESVEVVVKVMGTLNIADHVPILRPFDPQGIKKLAELHFGKMFLTFDSFINQRLEARKANNNTEGAKKNSDMLEALVDIMETSDGEFTCTDIKHLLMDLYGGSTSTTSAAVEWIMTELLRNPNVMSKVQAEVRAAFGMNDLQLVQESYISSKLPYLKAVVKETFRHHPPIALFGRASERDAEVNGYVIPKGSRLVINTYTIGRDPNAWSNPDKFYPERFILGTENNKDYKGLDFKLLPFGSGKRICPGLPLADRMIHNMVATLVHRFDWKLEPGLRPEDLDMTEKPRNALRKHVPLMAIPVKPR